MQLSGGHLSREALRSLPGAADGLVRKYIDKKGRRRHAGIAAKLKSSQRLGLTVRDTQRLGLMILFNLICIEPRSYTAEFGSCIADVALTPLQDRSLEISLDGFGLVVCVQL